MYSGKETRGRGGGEGDEGCWAWYLVSCPLMLSTEQHLFRKQFILWDVNGHVFAAIIARNSLTVNMPLILTCFFHRFITRRRHVALTTQLEACTTMLIHAGTIIATKHPGVSTSG